MEAQDCKGCPLVTIDPDVMHGEPVFMGTRMPVENAIEHYYAYRELKGLSDAEAVAAILHSFRTIPNPAAFRAVLAYEAAHENHLQP